MTDQLQRGIMIILTLLLIMFQAVLGDSPLGDCPRMHKLCEFCSINNLINFHSHITDSLLQLAATLLQLGRVCCQCMLFCGVSPEPHGSYAGLGVIVYLGACNYRFP